jgi:HD-GYP domain-containing protein (c-di-GMP phosphodiesterase class II)
MMLQTTNTTIPTTMAPNGGATGFAALVPPAAFESLCNRIRPAGLFLVGMGIDGSIAYHDSGAEPFFLRYALPLLKKQQASDSPVRQAVRCLTAAAAELPAGATPGLTIVTVPYVERRQTVGLLVIAGRAEGFSLTEEVLRACSQFQLDAGWLEAASRTLPSYSVDAVLRQAQLLQGMARDSVKLNGLEREVDNLSGQLANTYEELSLIYQISGGMKVNRGAADFFRQACHDVIEVMNVRGMGVVLGDIIVNRPAPAIYGTIDTPPRDVVERLHEQLMVTMRERKSSLLVRDLRLSPEFAFLAPYAQQMIAVPLQRQEEVLGGWFALDKCDGEEFDSVDSKLLNSIANESAIYLENARLFEDVHGLMMGLLHSLTSAVDAKDAYTCGHSERVALVSRHLATQAGLSDREVEQIYMAGLLHDVGKIGVPEAVLQKAGRLTSEEFEMIKRHPAIGARILQDVKQIREIIPGVLHHHERYDGKGYPAGLSGNDIPVMGRIICLADCFDAMTSSRTYRKALPLEVALTELRRCSGTQFDPALAEVFLRTSADGYRELLQDHHAKSKQFRELEEVLRPSAA